jgi:Flp pilus assembly protein TadD
MNNLRDTGTMTVSRSGRAAKLLRASPWCLLALALGCVSGTGRPASTRITTADLLYGAPLGVAGAPPVIPTTEVMAVSPEMRTFIDAHVHRKDANNLKLRELVAAIVSRDTFGLQYDEHTRTAAQTFRARRGNCLSFAAMFIAMARDLGLRAEFQEVDIPPDWSLDKDTFVLSRHINVFVDLGIAGRLGIDFNNADFRSSYDMRRITDARALAHFYNNVAVERMQAGDTAAAVANFREAINVDASGFSPAWMNLGTLYLRHGDTLYAEAAYLEALRADRSNLSVMSNLAELYESEGEAERAAGYRKRVIRHRMRNPYYRYQLAREAFESGDYDAAIRHLKYAVLEKQNEDRFYSLLSLCYARKGDEQAALRWQARAREAAAAEARKRGYYNNLNDLIQKRRPNAP